MVVAHWGESGQFQVRTGTGTQVKGANRTPPEKLAPERNRRGRSRPNLHLNRSGKRFAWWSEAGRRSTARSQAEARARALEEATKITPHPNQWKRSVVRVSARK
jgi:hypothetical protein